MVLSIILANISKILEEKRVSFLRSKAQPPSPAFITEAYSTFDIIHRKQGLNAYVSLYLSISQITIFIEVRQCNSLFTFPLSPTFEALLQFLCLPYHNSEHLAISLNGK